MRKAYEEYKATGIQWLPKIPRHWNIKRLKYISLKHFSGTWGNECDGSSNDKNCIRVADFNFENLSLSISNPTKRNYTCDEIRKYALQDGDILVEKSGGGTKTPVGRAIYYNLNGSFLYANFIEMIRVKKQNSKFLVYLLASMYHSGYINTMYNQTTGIQNLNINKYMNQLIVLPPREEQEQIVRFLDWKVSSINKLINLKQQEISDLKELKKATIGDAVTHGLDKTVPMKDSGISWLGKIPQHWEILKLRQILSSFSEKDHPNMPLLSVVREKGVIIRNTENTDENHNYIPDDLTNYKLVKAGQFAMNKMKAWQGSYGVSNHDGIVSPAYFVFNFTLDIDKQFFNVAIRSKPYVSFFGQASDGIRVGQWDLSMDRMKDIPFYVPPRDEQNHIARFLDARCTEIDCLIAENQAQITNLHDLKSSLIADVVTGKIDVRDVEIPDYEQVEETLYKSDDNDTLQSEDEIPEEV